MVTIWISLTFVELGMLVDKQYLGRADCNVPISGSLVVQQVLGFMGWCQQD